MLLLLKNALAFKFLKLVGELKVSLFSNQDLILIIFLIFLELLAKSFILNGLLLE
jgi:hypothetical protein